MTAVEFSPGARRDLARLRAWLEPMAPTAAERAVETLFAAARSLGEFPERGVLIRSNLRELIVPFGSTGYVVHYEVRTSRVIIARIYHSLEDR
jgi:plasmid stabilization system protein ParE